MANLSIIEFIIAIIFWGTIPSLVYLKTKDNPLYREKYEFNSIMVEIILSILIIVSIFLPWRVIKIGAVRELPGIDTTISKGLSLFDLITDGSFSYGETLILLLIVSPIIFALVNIFLRSAAISLYEGGIATALGLMFFHLGADDNPFTSIGIGVVFYFLIGMILVIKGSVSILMSPKQHIPFIVTHTAFLAYILCVILISFIGTKKTDIIQILFFVIALIISFLVALLVFKLMTKNNYKGEKVSMPITYSINSSSTGSEIDIIKEAIQGLEKSVFLDQTIQEQVKRINKKSIIRKYNYKKLILFGSVSIVLLGMLSGGYFLWYKPYSIERNAPRYYTFTNLNLRSSEDSESKDNIIEMIPYGTELITYGKGYSWARVKANGKEGHVAAYLILTKEDFQLLDGVWGNEDAKKCIGAAHYRLAVIDYLKRKEFSSGATEWQIFAKPYGGTLNTVSYPKFSQRKDGDGLIFIVKNNRTNERRLVVYGFTEKPKTPIYKTDISLEKDLSIRNVECRIEGYDILWIMITFNDGSYKIIESNL